MGELGKNLGSGLFFLGEMRDLTLSICYRYRAYRFPIPRTWRWRVTAYGRKVMGTTTYLREHHFPNVYARVKC